MAKATMPPTQDGTQDGNGIPIPAPAATPPAMSGSGAAGSQQGAAQAPAQPAFTLDDVRKLMSDELNNFSRQQQGLRAKLEARIEQRVTDSLKALQGAGITPTAEQAQALRMQVAQQVSAEDAPQASPPPTGTQAQPPAPTTPPAALPESVADTPHPFTVLAGNIMDAFQVDIEESDPEAKLIDWTDPGKLMVSVTAAIQAKQQRVARGQLPLAGGMGTPNPIANIIDPYDLIKEGLKE